MEAAPVRGWGPHSRTHEMLAEIGERLDQLIYVVGKAAGGSPKEPARWRRPGVLGAGDIAEIEAEVSAPVVADLEAERAEREARRRQAKQQR